MGQRSSMRLERVSIVLFCAVPRLHHAPCSTYKRASEQTAANADGHGRRRSHCADGPHPIPASGRASAEAFASSPRVLFGSGTEREGTIVDMSLSVCIRRTRSLVSARCASCGLVNIQRSTRTGRPCHLQLTPDRTRWPAALGRTTGRTSASGSPRIRGIPHSLITSDAYGRDSTTT